jgi:hypothetical protein
MRDHFKAVMPVLLAVLVGCPTQPDPVVPPPTGSTETLLGTVIVIGNERYDFTADTSTPENPLPNGITPDNPLAGASFTRQTGTSVVPADPFSSLREKCFDSSPNAFTTLFTSLKLELPTGTPIEAGSSITLSGGVVTFGTLSRTALGQYGPASALPKAVPKTLLVTVPGASGGFPASSDNISSSSIQQLRPDGLRPNGFKVNEPNNIGKQGDLDDTDITMQWTKGPVSSTGSSSVVIMEFYSIEQRDNRVTCLANDDGEFIFKASDPAYAQLKVGQVNPPKVRFESSARAVARVQKVNANSYLTTILVDRTVAVPPI